MALPLSVQCPECCECPQPIIQWDSVSASKTKSGYVEFGTASAPPVIYLQYLYAYLQRLAQCSGTGCTPDELIPANTVEQSVTGTYDPATGDTTQTGTDRAIGYDCSGIVSDVTTPISGSYAGTAVPNVCGLTPSGGTCTTVSTSSKTYVTPEYGCMESQPNSDVNGSLSLSVPFTTDDLIEQTLAALPEFDDDWSDTAGSYYDLTSDELTNSIRESRYRFRFRIPKVGSGTCYMITWTEVFTPEEGDPVETERCAIWDGETPEDYDPDDESTWPIIGDGSDPYFSLAIPESNGTITVPDDSILVVCRGCAGGC
jgi:hypothetical protein